MTAKALRWFCPKQGHYWNSRLMQASRVVDCDWCIFCGAVRPGHNDPREKWTDTCQ